MFNFGKKYYLKKKKLLKNCFKKITRKAIRADGYRISSTPNESS